MKVLAIVLSVATLAVNLFASEPLLPQRVLYIGHRASDFEPFLKKHFAEVKSVSLDEFKPSQAKDFHVVFLDLAAERQYARGLGLDGSPLGKREDWHKPTVLLGSAGLNLAVVWKLKGGSVALVLRPLLTICGTIRFSSRQFQ